MKTKMITESERRRMAQFADFLTKTLGPDLDESGHEFTAEDVIKAGEMIQRLLAVVEEKAR